MASNFRSPIHSEHNEPNSDSDEDSWPSQYEVCQFGPGNTVGQTYQAYGPGYEILGTMTGGGLRIGQWRCTVIGVCGSGSNGVTLYVQFPDGPIVVFKQLFALTLPELSADEYHGTRVMTRVESITHARASGSPYIAEFRGHLEDERGSIGFLMESLRPFQDVYGSRPLSEMGFLAVFHDVAAAILHLSQLDPAIFHRDIKQDNILVGNSGECKVSDFGAARSASCTAPVSVTGTIESMSPEARKGEQVGNQGDIFSLGVFMMKQLAGASVASANVFHLLVCATECLRAHSAVRLTAILRSCLSAALHGKLLDTIREKLWHDYVPETEVERVSALRMALALRSAGVPCVWDPVALWGRLQADDKSFSVCAWLVRLSTAGLIQDISLRDTIMERLLELAMHPLVATLVTPKGGIEAVSAALLRFPVDDAENHKFHRMGLRFLIQMLATVPDGVEYLVEVGDVVQMLVVGDGVATMIVMPEGWTLLRMILEKLTSEQKTCKRPELPKAVLAMLNRPDVLTRDETQTICSIVCELRSNHSKVLYRSNILDRLCELLTKWRPDADVTALIANACGSIIPLQSKNESLTDNAVVVTLQRLFELLERAVHAHPAHAELVGNSLKAMTRLCQTVAAHQGLCVNFCGRFQTVSTSLHIEPSIHCQSLEAMKEFGHSFFWKHTENYHFLSWLLASLIGGLGLPTPAPSLASEGLDRVLVSLSGELSAARRAGANFMSSERDLQQIIELLPNPRVNLEAHELALKTFHSWPAICQDQQRAKVLLLDHVINFIADGAYRYEKFPYGLSSFFARMKDSEQLISMVSPPMARRVGNAIFWLTECFRVQTCHKCFPRRTRTQRHLQGCRVLEVISALAVFSDTTHLAQRSLDLTSKFLKCLRRAHELGENGQTYRVLCTGLSQLVSIGACPGNLLQTSIGWVLNGYMNDDGVNRKPTLLRIAMLANLAKIEHGAAGIAIQDNGAILRELVLIAQDHFEVAHEAQKILIDIAAFPRLRRHVRRCGGLAAALWCLNYPYYDEDGNVNDEDAKIYSRGVLLRESMYAEL